MKSKEILAGQSVFDIALQERGALEATFEIAGQNGIAMTDSLQPGGRLLVDSDENDAVVSEYRSNFIHPATALADGLIPEGIGYMCIELDFIVS